MSTPTGLRKYRSHKVVEAMKIADILRMEDQEFGSDKKTVSYLLTADVPGSVRVDLAYYEKHTPKQGGYYVLYEDGYESFSPAEAFEAGYTLMQDPQGSGGAPG